MKKFEIFPESKLLQPFKNQRKIRLQEHSTAGICFSAQDVIGLSSKDNSKIDVFISFSPQATCMCKLKGCPYLNIEEFYDPDVFLISDEPMLEYQATIFKEMDNLLQEEIHEFKTFDFNPAQYYSFFLKVLSDMIFRASVSLSHLMISSGISHIYFFSPEQQQIDDTLFIGNNVYKNCLPLFCNTYGVKYTMLQPTKTAIGIDKTAKNNIRKFLRKCKRTLKNFLVPSHVPHTDYLVFKPGYDVDYVVEIFRNNKFPVVSFESILNIREIEKQANDILPGLYKTKNSLYRFLQETRFFVWAGVDCFSVVQPYFDYWYDRIIPRMYGSFITARNFFKRRRPSAVFLFSPWEVIDFGVLAAAENLNIPRILYQHGGFEGVCEYTCYDITELRQCDYRFVYGNSVADYFNERKSKLKGKLAELVPVGSARLDKLKMRMYDGKSIREKIRIPDNKTIVFYIPTAYQYHWYMCREAYLSCSYFEFLYKLCDIFVKFPDIQFVYKPFSELPEDPMAEILGLRVKNCTVVRDISVPEIIAVSDAVIIDIPSTALLEALLTDRPLLIFADSRFITLREKARQLLKKRAIVAEKPEEFYSCLVEFLSSKFEVLEQVDRSFIQEYGTYLDDGKSAERAFNKILEIIKNNG